MFNSWVFYTVSFIFLQVAFLQLFKLSTKKSNDIGALTVIVQVLSALFALLLSPFFQWKWPTDWKVWLLLGAALIFYAGADRLNATARKNLDISVESMLQQVWKMLFFISGIIFLHRSFTWLKLLGGVIIVLANISLFFEKGKFKLSKYALLKLIAIVCFTAAMTLDVSNSENFNLPFYVFVTFFGPALVLFIAGQARPSKILQELKQGNIVAIIFCALCNGFGAISILYAYQIDYFMAAAVSSVYVIINVFFSYIFLNERENLAKKIIAAVVVAAGLALTTLG